MSPLTLRKQEKVTDQNHLDRALQCVMTTLPMVDSVRGLQVVPENTFNFEWQGHKFIVSYTCVVYEIVNNEEKTTPVAVLIQALARTKQDAIEAENRK